MKIHVFASKAAVLALLGFHLKEAQSSLDLAKAEYDELEKATLIVDPNLNMKKMGIKSSMIAWEEEIKELTDKIALVESDETGNIQVDVEL